MNRAFILGLICTALVASCAEKVPDYKKFTATTDPYYASFKGKPVSSVIQEWGIPTKEYKTNGNTYLEWTKDVEVSENGSWSKRVPIGVSLKDNIWHKDIRYQYFATSKKSVTARNEKIIAVNE